MTSRSEFLGATAAAAVAPTIAQANGPAPSTIYDFAGIEAALARPARHRQVFAVARIADGNFAGLIAHGLDTYETTMAEGPGSLHPAAVFYARGVVLGLNDQMWKTFRLGLAARRRGEIFNSPIENANPFASQIRTLSGRGTTIFVCDNALEDWSRFLPSVMGTNASPESIHAEFRRNLMPGAILVPAGVVALNAAQEAHFTFVQASL